MVPGIDEPLMMIVGENRYFYHANEQGSVLALSNASGTLAETYLYSPYGELGFDGALGNPYLYTGRRYDPETGLYYYRARMYSATQRRFLQPDPIGYMGGMNLYAYVGNNPVMYVDPWGLLRLQDSMAYERFLEWVASYGELSNYPDQLLIDMLRLESNGVAVHTWCDDEVNALRIEGEKHRAFFAMALGAAILSRPRIANSAATNVPKVHPGKQGKHIPGHPNYQPGKSILRADPNILAQKGRNWATY